MKSLGVIETRGLVAAVQAVDAACKSAGVSCIGYRKVGSGLVSVCFEGEISAIHTAIERGVAVAALIDPQVKSLTIARPERSIVDALSALKGRPPRAEATAAAPLEAEAVAPAAVETREPTEPAAAPAPTEDKNAAMRKGKKA
ncbi:MULTISPECIES: BMC domain-containing protein [Klebsiella]|uniref:BMC domain-containing protein n=1 Tax=Klebsiella grimontii TaxID=2058152 RepID=A0A839CHQ4_9ENTR|nr:MULTISPECIES: BMC domain-containing protein [Klebsiella]BAS38615.1 propanediol utilization polyhedral body protein PduA [Klebsiella oxytoca]MBA8010359.1 BMC domain-containing protein [Klebsiella grimontii]MBA8123459.1 BMC domain-containing protein [Klebsiella grimontii]MBZ7216467.1 BMC domain-containing protein [Klebsiella grimontii]PEX82472.1 BMC domain-containing protein [Klebsiella sp. KG9]